MEMNFHSYFHFKWIPEREREREREREKHARTSAVRTHWALVCSVRKHQRHRSRSHAIDCDLTFAPIARDRDWRFARSWLTLREIMPSIAISPSRRLRSCEAARCFVRLRSMVWSSDWSLQSTAPSNSVEHQASIWVCLFLLLFQTPKNIFRKIFENAIKHMKTFSFPENGIFSGNAFTRTKHSLNISIQFQTLLKFTANLRGQFTMGHLLFLNIE